MNTTRIVLAAALISMAGLASSEAEARNRFGVSVGVRGVQVNVGSYRRGTHVSVGRNVYVAPRTVQTYRAPSRVRYSTPYVQYRQPTVVRYGRSTTVYPSTVHWNNRYYRGW